MKHLLYDHGPPQISAGDAGQFERGKAKPVADELAANLLARADIKFRVVKTPAKIKGGDK